MKTYNKGRQKREKTAGSYVRLLEYMMTTPAWQSLDCVSRCLYVELARRYRGPDSNNGKIPYSDREAAKALHVGRSTADRCFKILEGRGFIRKAKASGFNVKGRVATEWLLTEFPDDTKTGVLATKDFLRWEPPTDDAKAFHSPTTDRLSPTTGPGVDLTRDRVANGQR